MKLVALLVALNLSVASTNSAKSESETSQSPPTPSKVEASDSTDSRVEAQATPPTGPRFPLLALVLRDVAVPGGDHWGGDDFAGAGRGGRRASRRVARA